MDYTQTQALSLVAALYDAMHDAPRFTAAVDRCHGWLRQPAVAGSPGASFLRRQLVRTGELRSAEAADRAGTSSRFAVISVDDRGGLLAAGDEAWDLLGSGDPARDPLRLPSTFRRHLIEAGASGAQLPRALRVPLDGGDREVAAVLLESGAVQHATGVLRVATFLLCSMPAAARPIAAPVPRSERSREELPLRRAVKRARPVHLRIVHDRTKAVTHCR